MLGAAHYVDRGSGLPIVFSHGTLMDWSMFEPQLAVLQDRYRVIAFDHRARTPRYDDPYKLVDLTDDCRALLDQLGVKRCVLAGMSMGGFMALEFALRYPERVSALILISTMAGAYTADEQSQYGEAFSALDNEGNVPRPFAEWIASLCFGASTQRNNTQLVSQWVDKWCNIPSRSFYNEAHSWLDKRDLTSKLAGLSLPCLLVHGDEDTVLTISRAAQPMATHLPNSKLIQVSGAGHSVNLEDARTVNTAILEFLQTLKPAQ